METRVQIPNEKANEFEGFANEFFRQMNPVRNEANDFWTTFEFDTVTDVEEERVTDFAQTFCESKC